MSEEMRIIQKWDLESDYSIARVEKLPDAQYLEQFNSHLLQGYPVLPWQASLSHEQKQRYDSLKVGLSQRFQLKLALLHSGQMIGWSYGWHDSVHSGDFYMAGSLVLPEHRGRKLYSRLVQKILEVTQEEGFTAVRSRHICTNNAVLIAKLKLGFMINGFEQDETMGTLVKMVYHHNELRKKAALFRAGKVSESEVFNQLSLESSH